MDTIPQQLNQTYTIQFRMKFQTKVGQDLCVLGSIPELGNWNKGGNMESFKPNMVWTEGHIW